MRWFAVIGAVALALGVPGGPTAASAAPAAGSGNPFDRIVPLARIGEPLPSTTFVDQDGRPLRFSDLRGSAVAVAFVYTHCRDACPIITRKLGAVESLVGVSAVKIVEVTIDPAHDTSHAIAAYANEFGMRAPQWRIVTGGPSSVDDFDRRLGVQAIASGGDQVIHNDRIVLVEPSGIIEGFVDGESWTPADLAAQLNDLQGQRSSWLARADLALGAALAFCGGAIAGRAGIGDLLASIAVIAGVIAAFVFFVRRTSAARV